MPPKDQLQVIVEECKIFRRGDFAVTVNPFVRIAVDGFPPCQTKARKNDYNPTFGEQFSFSNVARDSIIEVSVVSSITGILDAVVGLCSVSLGRIPSSGERSQWYLLSTVNTFPDVAPSEEVQRCRSISAAGIIKITLRSVGLVSAHLHRLNLEAEGAFMRRIERFFMFYDRRHLSSVSTIIGDAVDWSEVCSPRAGGTTSTAGDDGCTTFDELLQHLTENYGPEPVAKSVHVAITGASGLVKPQDHPAISPFVAIVSDWEQLETSPALGESDPLFTTEHTFTTIDPAEDILQIIVVNNSRFRENALIGKAQVALSTLACGEKNDRTVPIILASSEKGSSGEGDLVVVAGYVHLCLVPADFGFVDVADSKYCEEFYSRLARFFERYDPRQLPSIDDLIRSNIRSLDGLMTNLVGTYGREPGSAALHVAVQQIRWLSVTPGQMMDTRVVLKVTMGDVVLYSKPVRYSTYSITHIDETFLVDVARETDVLTIEVLSADDVNNTSLSLSPDDSPKKTATACYGRVDLTVVAIQRTVLHTRTYTLVANAGKEYARCSGQIVVQLLSNDVGKETFVDDDYEEYHTNRLRRFCAKYLREKLHRVDIAVATTFDMELFMRDLVADFGPEPAVQQLVVRVLGAKNLPNRMGGLNPCVSVVYGMQICVTAPQKSTNPTFGDVFTFEIERSAENEVVFAVLDAGEHGGSRSVVGQALLRTTDLSMDVEATHWLEIKGRTGSGTIGVQFLMSPLPNLQARSASVPSSSNADAHGRGPSPVEPSSHAAAAAVQRPSSRNSSPPHPSTPRQVPAGGSRPSPRVRTLSPAKPSLDASSLAVQSSATPTANRMRQEFPTPNSQHRKTTPRRDGVQHQSTSMPPSALQLQVKIYRCEKLFIPNCAQTPPQMTPYVSVTTELSKFRTPDAPVATYEPEYGQSFVVRLRDLETDAIRISVQTAQEGKKVAIIGKAILSAKGLRKGVEKVLWVDLVHGAGKAQAYYRGKIKLGLTAPADFPPLDSQSDAEQALLRVRARQFLMEKAPQELHKLEFFLGEFSAAPDRLLPKLHELFDPKASAAPVPMNVVAPAPLAPTPSSQAIAVAESDFHIVKVSVVGAQLLWFQQHPETAVVKIKSSLEKFVTSAHPARRKLIEFDEYFACRVESTTPSSASASSPSLELTLVGRDDSGRDILVAMACVSAVAGLVRGCSQDRSVLLVTGAGTKSARVVGSLSLSLETTNPLAPVGDPSTIESPRIRKEASQKRMRRLQRVLERCRPQELHQMDLLLSDPRVDIEQYVSSLLNGFGAEPAVYSLEVSVGTVQHLPRTDSTRGGCTPYVVLAVGSHQHVTRTIKTGSCSAAFGESFLFELTAPDRDLLTVIVMDVGASCDTESGRVVIPLSHLSLGFARTSVHSLTFEAMLTRAQRQGEIKLHMTAKDFGGSVAMVAAQQRTEVVAAVEEELQRRRPDLLHTAECIAARHGFIKAAALAEVIELPSVDIHRNVPTSAAASAAGAGEGSSSSSHVLILGVRRFYNAPCGKIATPPSVTVKLAVGGATIGKTPPIKLHEGLDATFPPATCKFATPCLKPTDVLTFKIAVPRLVVGSTVLAFVDMTVSRIPPGGETRWLPFYNEVTGDRLGYLGVHVHIDPTSVVAAANNSSSSKSSQQHFSAVDRAPNSAIARVMEDVASLLRKHKPALLRNLAVHVEQASSLEVVHSQLRSSFVSLAICSLDFTIHTVQLLGSKVTSGSGPKSQLSVRITCNTDQSTTPAFEASMATSLVDCCARLDIARIDELTPLVFELLVDGTVIAAAARFPLRALLTRTLFQIGDVVALPLVAVEHSGIVGGSSVAQAARRSSVQAEVRFSIRTPLFEEIPPMLPYPDRCASLFDRSFIMYYYDRIRLYLSIHEPEALVDFSARFFDFDVARSPWAEVLPARLDRLISSYGAEAAAVARAGSPPKLTDATKRALYDQFSSGSATPISSRKGRRTPLHNTSGSS